jgi:hypothetical protein
MILTLYSFMDDNNGEDNKKAYHESINFAMQGMGENSQFTVAIAIGVFGILAIFVSLDSHKNMTAGDSLWENALWTQPLWIWSAGIILSIAYWALVLFGIQTYVSRRLFEGIMGDYLKRMNEEWYYNDIKEIAKENKLANLIFKKIWSSNHERKERYKGMYNVLILYLGIAFFLWLFIIIL